MTATATPRSSIPEHDGYAGEEMTLVEHLRELRSRLFKSVSAIVLGLVAGYALSDRTLEVLSRPYCNLPEELRRGADVLAGAGADCALRAASWPESRPGQFAASGTRAESAPLAAKGSQREASGELTG